MSDLSQDLNIKDRVGDDVPSNNSTNENPASHDSSAPPDPTHNDSGLDARTRANRENAQHSTGPRTPEGKAASSRNSRTHGLFVEDLKDYFRTEEEAERYQRFIDTYIASVEPVGGRELILAHRCADIQFRLDMLANAERKVYSGAGLVADTMEAELNRSGDMMRLATLYDTRFQRSYNHTKAELEQVQAKRKEAEKKAIEELKSIAQAHIHEGATFDPAKFGFVISRDLVFAQAHLANARKLSGVGPTNGIMEKKAVDYVAKIPPKAA
jgi:hypothetical protein